MSKTLKEEIVKLIKEDFRNPDIEVKDLKVSFTVVEQTETGYEIESEEEAPKKPRGPKPGKKKGRRGRKKGSKNKVKEDSVTKNPDVIPGGQKEE